MARNTTGGSYLTNANAIITGYPFTMFCWYYFADLLGGFYTLMSVANGGTLTDYFGIWQNGSTSLEFAARSATAGQFLADTTIGPSATTWQNVCCVGTSATSRDIYINGANKGSNTSAVTPSGLSRSGIGVLCRSSNDNTNNSLVAHAAIWNAALTVAEIGALAKGVLPYRIRPASLKSYAPLWGLQSPEPDFSNQGLSWTLVSAPAAANDAPVSPFLQEQWPTSPIVGPSSVVNAPVAGGRILTGGRM